MKDTKTTATATSAPASKGQEWLSTRTDLIEGRCGCKMTLEQCKARQAKYNHISQGHHGTGTHGREETRPMFIRCTGGPEDEPCQYYEEKPYDPNKSHRSFRVSVNFTQSELQAIHKRNRFNRATRGVVTARNER